mgnify:FL=1
MLLTLNWHKNFKNLLILQQGEFHVSLNPIHMNLLSLWQTNQEFGILHNNLLHILINAA